VSGSAKSSAGLAGSTAIVLRFGLKSRRHSTLGCWPGLVRERSEAALRGKIQQLPFRRPIAELWVALPQRPATAEQAKVSTAAFVSLHL
jgi:hypothetical protein